MNKKDVIYSIWLLLSFAFCVAAYNISEGWVLNLIYELGMITFAMHVLRGRLIPFMIAFIMAIGCIYQIIKESVGYGEVELVTDHLLGYCGVVLLFITLAIVAYKHAK